MRPYPAGWVLGSFLGLMVLGVGGGVRASEPPSDRMLEERGLKRAGPLFVLEDETIVQAKTDEVRAMGQQLNHAIAKQRATLSEKEYQDTIKELNNELNQLRAQSNLVTQNINRIPKRRGYPVYYEEYQELTYYRNQLQMEISQRTAFLNQIKSQPFDPKARIKADADVQTRRNELQQGAQELRKLIDDVKEKYTAVGKDPKVKKWLDTPEGHAGVKPKLGPSHTFKLDEKFLERIERETGSDDPFGATQKAATKKGRRTTRTKHAAGSGNAGSPF